MAGWEGFSGINRGYVLELYERFRKDPSSVDPATRAIFEQWTPPADADAATGPTTDAPARLAVAAVNLAQAIRRYGHLAPHLDPLRSTPPAHPSPLPPRPCLPHEQLPR